MSDMFRMFLKRLALLSLIASFAFALGASPASAQDDGADETGDITAPDENDASDADSSDGSDDTADLTNETSDDGDDTADLTNETSDDGDDTADLTNETSDDGDDTADLTNETSDDGDADATDDDGSDGQVEELPSTGQGPQQDGNGLELTILASVVLAVIASFVWTRRSHPSS